VRRNDKDTLNTYKLNIDLVFKIIETCLSTQSLLMVIFPAWYQRFRKQFQPNCATPLSASQLFEASLHGDFFVFFVALLPIFYSLICSISFIPYFAKLKRKFGGNTV